MGEERSQANHLHDPMDDFAANVDANVRRRMTRVLESTAKANLLAPGFVRALQKNGWDVENLLIEENEGRRIEIGSVRDWNTEATVRKE